MPDSLRAHPIGSVLDVPVLASVLKSCVYADPNVVRLMHVDAAVLLVSELTMTAMAKVTNTLSPMNDPSREAECLNSESKGEELFFISCLSPAPAADWKWRCPRQPNQMARFSTHSVFRKNLRRKVARIVS